MKDGFTKEKEGKPKDSNEISLVSLEDMKQATGGHGIPVVTKTKDISKKEKDKV
jgi:hypothetical protein